MNLKEQLKRMEKEQKKYQKLIKASQSLCPHVKKNGKTRLGDSFTENGIEMRICDKCGAKVIVDADVLSAESVALSTAVVRTALAEIRAQEKMGKIKINDETMKLMADFDTEILADLSEFMSTSATGGKKKKKDKKRKKKDKKDKKKHNDRRRWN